MGDVPESQVPSSVKGVRDQPVRRGRPRHTERSAAYLARREEIVVTAARVFSQKGYAQGSLEDVASELGLRKSALYYYVSSKAHLLYLIFDHTVTRALNHFAELDSVPDPKARLAGMIRYQVHEMAENLEYIAVFFDQRPRLDEEYEAHFRVKERAYLRMFARAVDEAIQGGAINTVDIRSAAQGILGMTSWVYKWFDPTRDDPDLIADAFIRLLGMESVTAEE